MLPKPRTKCRCIVETINDNRCKRLLTGAFNRTDQASICCIKHIIATVWPYAGDIR
jgi:hypothetical protein